MGTSGVVKNLGVNGAGEKAAEGNSYGHNQYTGILAASNEGTIDKCHTKGNVSASSPSYYSYVGGLAGHNGGSISNSYATGNASASPSSSPARSYAGGLAGYSDSGHISNSYAAGSASSLLSLNATVVPGTMWGRSDAKNDKLPYINGVGVGK